MLLLISPSPNLQSVFKMTCPWWLRQYYLQTFKTWSDSSLWHKVYTSYPIINYVNPCSLIQGQLRGVVAGMWSPAGSDGSSAYVWLNHPQGKQGCLRDTDWPQSCLSPYLSPQGHTQTCTHTTCFHLHVFFLFSVGTTHLHFIFKRFSSSSLTISAKVSQYHLLLHQHVKQPVKSRAIDWESLWQ